MKEVRRTRLSELGLVLAAFLWGMAFAVVKDTNRFIAPSWQIGIRFGGAALLMLLLFRKRLKSVSRRTLLGGALLGSILFLAYLTQSIGVKYTTAGKNAFLTAVYVVIVPFLYGAIRRIKPEASNIAAAFLCLAGIGLLSLDSSRFGLGLGEELTLVCGLLYAIHITFTGLFMEDCDPMAINTIQFAVCSILGFLLACFTEPLPVFNRQSSIGIIYLMVFSTCIGMGLQTACQKNLATGKASLLMSLESVFGCIGGVLLLGERLTTQNIFGFVLIFIAVVLTEVPLHPQKKRHVLSPAEPGTAERT
ncbi:MAG: DMT family transporter [Oscillospiraceae bacterium]|nr:DMT family transporter [Oscillospiraceae bacterium]MDD3261953.1 DMT family transporter [Oscillospiraceae bacterium]